MQVIGLTGGIASGKSTVASKLKSLGFKIVDADKITKDFYQDKVNLQLVKAAINVDDISSIREVVFKDKQALKKLEMLIHPYVKGKIKDFISDCRKSEEDKIFLEVPLLLEGELWKLCDHIIYICADEQERIKRFLARGKGGAEIFHSIKEKQITLEKAKKFKPFIIENNQGEDYLTQQIFNILAKIDKD